MGTTDFLESAYRQYHDAALRFVKSYVRDEMTSEDIVADAFLELWKIERREEVERPYPLLITILRHRSLNWLKRERIKQVAMDHMATGRSRDLNYRIMALEACNPEELFSEEIREIVERTLETMSPMTAKIFAMSRWENMSAKEIAEKVGLTTKSVEYHITKALKTLRRALDGYLALLILMMRV